MASQCWCVVGWNVGVGLKVVAPVAIDKLSFLHLIGTLMSKSFIGYVSAHLLPQFPHDGLIGFFFLDYSFCSSVHPSLPL